MEVEEAWKPAHGLNGYEVSNMGRVRSVTRHVADGKGHQRFLRGKDLSPRQDGKGYHQVCLCQEGTRYTKKVHILVLEAFVGPKPEGKETRHLNGDRHDNRLSNLKWGTRAENAADRTRHGSQTGEKNGRAKLTSLKVRVIRMAFRKGTKSQRMLAEKYGVSSTTISRVIRGENWAHVPRKSNKIRRWNKARTVQRFYRAAGFI